MPEVANICHAGWLYVVDDICNSVVCRGVGVELLELLLLSLLLFGYGLFVHKVGDVP